MINCLKILLFACFFVSGCASTQNPDTFYSIPNNKAYIEEFSENKYKISLKGRKNQSETELNQEIFQIIKKIGTSNKYDWYIIIEEEIAKQNFRDLGVADAGLSLFKLWANYQIGPQNSPYGYKYYQFKSDNTPLKEIEYEIIAKSFTLEFGKGQKPNNANFIFK